MDSHEPHRLLVVANEAITADRLVEDLRRRVSDRDSEVVVIAPATVSSALKHVTGDVDDAIEAANGLLERSLQALRSAGIDATGRVGDTDPEMAVEQALAEFPADEILISSHEEGEEAWLEKGVAEKIRERTDRPVTKATIERDGAERVAGIERIQSGDATAQKRAIHVPYLPPLQIRDAAAMVVGILGTLVLALLAAGCGEPIFESGCVARLLIALGGFYLTSWHVFALVMTGAVRERGRAEGLLAAALLTLIPIGIIASLLVE